MRLVEEESLADNDDSAVKELLGITGWDTSAAAVRERRERTTGDNVTPTVVLRAAAAALRR